MLNAEEKLIRKLIFESDVSRYRIAKDTGIPSNTLSDIHTGKTSIARMRFGTAAKLTEYAKEMEKMLAVKDSMDKIIDLKETIDRSRRGLPDIAIYENKAEILEMLSATGDEDVDWAEYVEEAYADFEDDEKIIEVNLGDGLPEKFHAHEFEAIDEYTN